MTKCLVMTTHALPHVICGECMVPLPCVRLLLLLSVKILCAALQTLIELRLIFGGFHGGKFGSDVLLTLNLMNKGLRRVTDSYNVQTKRKSLTIRHCDDKSKSTAQSVHDTCICGGPSLMHACQLPKTTNHLKTRQSATMSCIALQQPDKATRMRPERIYGKPSHLCQTGQTQ